MKSDGCFDDEQYDKIVSAFLANDNDCQTQITPPLEWYSQDSENLRAVEQLRRNVPDLMPEVCESPREHDLARCCCDELDYQLDLSTTKDEGITTNARVLEFANSRIQSYSNKFTGRELANVVTWLSGQYDIAADKETGRICYRPIAVTA
jgi:hypothetical protein